MVSILGYIKLKHEKLRNITQTPDSVVVLGVQLLGNSVCGME